MYFDCKMRFFDIILRYALALILSFYNYIFYTLSLPITFEMSYFISNILFGASKQGDLIIIGNESFRFIPECTAALAYLLLALLILTTKEIGLIKGLTIFVSGSLLILAANIFRIEFMIYILLNYGVDYFKTLH